MSHILERCRRPGSALLLGALRAWVGVYLTWLFCTPMFALLAELQPPFLKITGTTFPSQLELWILRDLLLPLQAVALVSAACLALGLCSRASAAVLLVAFLGLYNTYFRATKSHVEWPYWTFILMVLALSHCGDRLSLDAWLRRLRGKAKTQRDSIEYRWPVEAVVCFLSVVYVSAGVAKLLPLRAGMEWLTGNMAHHLAALFYFDSPIYWALGEQPLDLSLHWPFALGAALTAIVELLAVALLLTEKSYLPVAVSIFGFHFGFYLLTGVIAFPMVFLACTPFLIPPHWLPDCDPGSGTTAPPSARAP